MNEPDRTVSLTLAPLAAAASLRSEGAGALAGQAGDLRVRGSVLNLPLQAQIPKRAVYFSSFYLTPNV